MMRLREAAAKIVHLLAVVADWLLIIAGAVLVLIALKNIDVPVAQYAVAGAGVFFAVIGFYCRFRRLHKKSP